MLRTFEAIKRSRFLNGNFTVCPNSQNLSVRFFIFISVIPNFRIEANILQPSLVKKCETTCFIFFASNSLTKRPQDLILNL